MDGFSHVDAAGRPQMVDVSAKAATLRTAHARAVVTAPAAVMAALEGDDIRTPKGPVFRTACIAGMMAAKRTSELIPLCHPIALEGCEIEIHAPGPDRIAIDCRVKTHHKTGVEMEALTGASVAALTVYDMCKAISHDLTIAEVRLIEKRGGKSDIGGEGA